jgi:O-antigen biosynthesis protein WbqP
MTNVGIMYKNFFKRVIDLFLSLVGLIFLALPMLVIAIAIKCDSKGPVFFKQKRVGIHKKTFMILKFRTMRVDTPHDAPTHELSDPTKWITKVGGFLRKTSLDELPQILNIIAGQMAVIGPRPALWNQDDLIAERDKYGANDVKPGLTGWAQINGRDELEIPVKAKLDGEYVQKMSFLFDCKCFFGTIITVLKHDGVVEGGTGELKKEAEEKNSAAEQTELPTNNQTEIADSMEEK